MRYRFIEYEGNIYVVVGIGYGPDGIDPYYFMGSLLNRSGIISASLEPHTIAIPFDEAIEITSKIRLLALRILYG